MDILMHAYIQSMNFFLFISRTSLTFRFQYFILGIYLIDLDSSYNHQLVINSYIMCVSQYSFV